LRPTIHLSDADLNDVIYKVRECLDYILSKTRIYNRSGKGSKYYPNDKVIEYDFSKFLEQISEKDISKRELHDRILQDKLTDVIGLVFDAETY
jgi:hypothetical protein